MTALTDEVVLTLNSGSSSLKFGIHRSAAGDPVTVFASEIEGVTDGRAALEEMFDALAGAAAPTPTVIGHRIVHGGPALTSHCLIDAGVIAQLEVAIPFAPLHGPAAIAVINAATSIYPAVPQIACFDTAFHSTLPPVASALPLPKALRAEGIRRYGFHGLSCASIVHRLRDDLPDRLVIAHLGNGASITAVKAGRSLDTSMGLTPSGGVMMSTRSGDIDPGVLIHLLRSKALDAAGLEDLIDRQSGMLGVSGTSGDMRALHAAAPTDIDARRAIAMFCRSVSKQIAGMIAVLGGIDMLVFTGGIGEHDAIVRDRITEDLSWAGVPGHTGGDQADACCRTRVLAAREDEQIARYSCDVVRLMPNRS